MRTVLALVLAAALLVAAAAHADPPARAAAGDVWATVNVCDTQARPNQIGIRGGMDGLARRTRMFMRFRVQYQTLEGEWRTVRTGADSGWRTRRRRAAAASTTPAGRSSSSRRRRAARTCCAGSSTFEWRRGGRVVERERTFTEAGHPGTAGADPPDFSAATCAIA